ncbi:MAG: ATP-binding protein [Verrucomicrobiales bacterium]|nr:ATP-binding protein [Verrucomicrobiales bacterium]
MLIAERQLLAAVRDHTFFSASAWVREHRNGIITGPTGIGKSHLACALGHQACRDGLRTHHCMRRSSFAPWRPRRPKAAWST